MFSEQELAEVAERFDRAVFRTGGCSVWLGARTPAGYGRLIGLGEVYAHRISWILANRRPIPEGLLILHSCDNPPCVNPEHLRAGTQAENMADAKRRGRNAFGERQHNTRMIDDDIRVIRWLAEEGEITTAQMALVWQVHPSTIRRIVRRDDWRHVA